VALAVLQASPVPVTIVRAISATGADVTSDDESATGV
jgi:hypothetical protein